MFFFFDVYRQRGFLFVKENTARASVHNSVTRPSKREIHGKTVGEIETYEIFTREKISPQMSYLRDTGFLRKTINRAVFIRNYEVLITGLLSCTSYIVILIFHKNFVFKSLEKRRIVDKIFNG